MADSEIDTNFSLDIIKIDCIKFDGQTCFYDGEKDPIFSLPASIISNNKGFRYVGNDIILAFNADQYIYEILRDVTLFLEDGNKDFVYPIVIYNNVCTLRLKFDNPRIPAHLVSNNENIKCFINILDELKDFLSTGLHFLLQFQIRKNIEKSRYEFVIKSIDFPDIMGGRLKYLGVYDNDIGDSDDDEDDDNDELIIKI
jgi:hypothetical protein